MSSATSTPRTADVDRMFRAFSDRTRLRILNLLRHVPEVCVCDMIKVIGVPQAKVSRHLAYLRRAGLVLGRKDGLWVHYRLVRAKGAFHAKILECLSCCFTEVPELRGDLTRLKCRRRISALRC
jgi:ArsR family transcriptional regulator